MRGFPRRDTLVGRASVAPGAIEGRGGGSAEGPVGEAMAIWDAAPLMGRAEKGREMEDAARYLSASGLRGRELVRVAVA